MFAGGDDFFLIGPWFDTQQLAADMAAHFTRYVAANPDIHFSAGLVMASPACPSHTLCGPGRRGPRHRQGPGARTPLVHVRWPAGRLGRLARLAAAADELDGLDRDYRLSTGYVYGLLQLVDLATAPHNPESPCGAAASPPHPALRVDKLPDARAHRPGPAGHRIGEQGIASLGGAYRIPSSTTSIANAKRGFPMNHDRRPRPAASAASAHRPGPQASTPPRSGSAPTCPSTLFADIAQEAAHSLAAAGGRQKQIHPVPQVLRRTRHVARQARLRKPPTPAPPNTASSPLHQDDERQRSPTPAGAATGQELRAASSPTSSARSPAPATLKNAKFFMEAVLGFLKAEEK